MTDKTCIAIAAEALKLKRAGMYHDAGLKYEQASDCTLSRRRRAHYLLAALRCFHYHYQRGAAGYEYSGHG